MGLSLSERILTARTVKQKRDLHDDCTQLLLHDPRLMGLPAMDATVDPEAELDEEEPTELSSYPDVVRAVCYLAAAARPAVPTNCPNCHKTGGLTMQLTYGGPKAGRWHLIHTEVSSSHLLERTLT